jgi:hypothetical protein
LPMGTCITVLSLSTPDLLEIFTRWDHLINSGGWKDVGGHCSVLIPHCPMWRTYKGSVSLMGSWL